MLGCRPAQAAAGLPLQNLRCDVPCTAALVSMLAAVAPQLTYLSLHVAGEAVGNDTALQHALAALTGLQDLTLGVYSPLKEPKEDLFDGIAPALQHLTRLTALNLAPGRQHVGGPLHLPCVQDRHLQLLPVSLATLELIEAEPALPVNMSHLTAVTDLWIEHVAEGDVLPPNLKELSLSGSHSLMPLFKNGPVCLRLLSLNCIGSVSLGVPAGLSVLSGLESLQVTMQYDADVALGWFEQLPKLPLIAFLG